MESEKLCVLGFLFLVAVINLISGGDKIASGALAILIITMCIVG